MKILTISNYFPYPPQDGTKIQIFQRIRYLSESHRVTLLCVVDQEPDPGLVAAMTRYCEVHVILRPKVQLSEGAWERAVNFLRSYISGIPYYFIDGVRTEARQWIRRQQGSQKFDVVEADNGADYTCASLWMRLKYGFCIASPTPVRSEDCALFEAGSIDF